MPFRKLETIYDLFFFTIDECHEMDTYAIQIGGRIFLFFKQYL